MIAGAGGYYWTSTEYDYANACRLDVGTSYVAVSFYNKSNSFPVRCVKGNGVIS